MRDLGVTVDVRNPLSDSQGPQTQGLQAALKIQVCYVMTAVSSRAVQTRRLHLCLEWSGEVYPCPHLWQLRSRPSLRFQGHGPIVKWLPALARAERLPGASRHWSSPRVLATSVPACCVAPDHRPSLDLGQSRHMASTFAVAGWQQIQCRMQPQPG